MRAKLAGIALRTSLLYVLVAAVWILVSDKLVATFFSDPRSISWISMCKGWSFVAVTGLLLYFTLRSQLRKWEAASAERKRAEAALADEVNLRRVLFERSPDGMVIIDPETARLIEFNEAAHRQLGYSREEFARLSIFDLEALETPAETRLRIQTVVREGKVDFETRQRTRQGEIRDVHVTAQTIKVQHRTVYHCVWRDITERKRARQSLEMFRFSIDQASDAVFWMNREAGFTYVNEQACLSLGYTREELLRLNLGDIDPVFPKDLWDARWEGYQPDRRGGVEHLVSVHRRKDGSTYPVELVSKHLWFGDEELHVAFARDITERQRVETALRGSEERLTQILETVPDAIALVNLRGQITYANRSAERILGLTCSGIAGRTYNDSAWNSTTTDGRPFPDEEQPFSRVMRSGQPVYGIEQVVEQPEARRVILSVNAAPLRDASGNLAGMVAAFTDITDRKRADNTLRESEERYRSLFTAMQEGFALHEVICDAEGRPQDYRYLEVNPAFERITGVPRAQWIGHTVREVLPHVEESWVRVFGEVALTGVARTVENYVKELDRYYQVLAYSPARGQFAVLALDVTGYRRAEESLRQKTEELDRYFSTALDLFCIADTDGRFRRLNKQWEKTLGYSVQELEGRAFLDFVHPEDRAITLQTSLRAGQEQVHSFVNRYRRKDGEYRWIEWTSQAGGNLIFAAARDITERRRAAAELEQNHEQYRRAIAAAGAIPYQKDYGSDHYVFMGEGIKDLLGYAPAELRSSVWREIILETQFLGEAAGLTVAEAARRAVAGDIKNWRADHRIRTRGGAIRWISDSSIPLHDESGRYIGSMGIIQDITERKLAEQAVRESEASLARAQRVAHLGSWEADLAQETLHWSEETFRIFGLTPDTFVPTRAAFLEMVHPEDRARVRAAALHARQTLQPYAVDHRILRADGTERIVSERADVLLDAAGVPVRLVGTVQDVTELKRIEQALQRSEHHFRSIIENVQDLISIVDAGGVMRFVSPSTERALGHRPDALLSRSAFEFIAPEDAAPVRLAIERAFRHPDQTVTVEYRFRHADGSWRWLESIGHVLAGEDPAVVIVNTRDITDRRRLEDQLRQSQKMEAIGQLAGGVAHDFNNVLTVIQGNATLLLDEPSMSGEANVCARQIVEAAQRAAGLTRQLLMFSRKQVMQLVDLDLNEVCGHMTKMLQRILGEDIALQSEYAPRLPLVRGDTGMLEQIVLNLAVNARDAMPEGGRLIIQTAAVSVDQAYLTEHPDAALGLCVRLTVSDTGTGIPPGDLPHIFEPFFTTKEVGKGTGLGLATVYGIVRQHRGWIEVQSELGQGTRFSIHLPVSEITRSESEMTTAIPEMPRGDEVVLLVEDEAAVCSLVEQLLQRCGYTVLAADSGVAAVKLWRENRDRIQLLLTDLIMPGGISGRDLAIQLTGDRPDLKVLFTSGYISDHVSKGLTLDEGVNFLRKPYQPTELAKAVRRCLDAE